MRITPKLKEQMESDIFACESHTEIKGSEKLYSELVAKYFVFDRSFEKGLSTNGKYAAVGSEFDYRPELRAIAAKLKMYLLMNETDDAPIKTIDQLLAEDIRRCKQYLNNPDNEETGRDLYIEITGRYDKVISGFGDGLYQYAAEFHFYDPEIDGESLIFNLKLLLNKMISHQAVTYSVQTNPIDKEEKSMSNKVFIVHGHDNEAKLEAARTLEKGGFDPIILHEQPDAGMTIIEKIERYAKDVCYAVILYTECDVGRDRNVPADQERFRARQNVVFEHGYLISRLGRDHVSALVKGNVETPGDIDGVIYIGMDKNGAWKMQLATNMQDVGLPVDKNTFCR